MLGQIEREILSLSWHADDAEYGPSVATVTRCSRPKCHETCSITFDYSDVCVWCLKLNSETYARRARMLHTTKISYSSWWIYIRNRMSWRVISCSRWYSWQYNERLKNVAIFHWTNKNASGMLESVRSPYVCFQINICNIGDGSIFPNVCKWKILRFAYINFEMVQCIHLLRCAYSMQVWRRHWHKEKNDTEFSNGMCSWWPTNEASDQSFWWVFFFWSFFSYASARSHGNVSETPNKIYTFL